MIVTWRRRIGRAGGHPAISARIVSAAGVEIRGRCNSAPHHHFTLSPDCCVVVSGIGGVCHARGHPTVSAGSISAAGVQIVGISSTPDDHFIASPDRRGKKSARGRVGRAGGCPTIGAGIVSPAAVHIDDVPTPPQTIISLPVHTAVCTVRASGALVVLVATQLSLIGLYLPPVLRTGHDAISSAPNDHFTACPHCRVTDSAIRRVGCVSGCPTIRHGIVPAAVVKKVDGIVKPAPDNHFATAPHCSVTHSRRGSVASGSCPTIGAGIVSPARVEHESTTSAPDDHFTPESRLLCVQFELPAH